MTSPIVKLLIVAATLAGAALAYAQGPGQTPADAKLASIGSASSYVVASSGSARSVADVPVQHDNAVISVATSLPPSTVFPMAQALNKPQMSNRGLKDWMLIALGLFLVITISQRRARSLSEF